MGDIKKILNPIAKAVAVAAPIVGIVSGQPALGFAVAAVAGSVASATAPGKSTFTPQAAASVAALGAALSKQGLATPAPDALRQETLEANSAMQVAAIAAGVDVSEAGVNSLRQDVGVPIKEARDIWGDINYTQSRVVGPRQTHAQENLAAGMLDSAQRTHELGGRVAGMSNGLLHVLAGLLLPELRGMNSQVGNLAFGMLSALTPLALRGMGLTEFSGPRPLERLIAGTVLGPRQMGSSMVSAYYNNPPVIGGHLAAVRAQESSAFLRAAARARAI